MSVRVMEMVFNSNLKPNQKLVCLVLADMGNDDGIGVYYGVWKIALRSGYSDRSVQFALRELEQEGILQISYMTSKYRTNDYRIVVDELKKREIPAEIREHKSKQKSADIGCKDFTQLGEDSARCKDFTPDGEKISPMTVKRFHPTHEITRKSTREIPQTPNKISKTENGGTRIEDSSVSKGMGNQTPPSSGQPPVGKLPKLPKLTPLPWVSNDKKKGSA